MAHFAKLDSNNIVTEIVVVNNDVLLKADNTESEYKGKTFLNSLLGSATWVQTSYNNSFRKQFAGIGFKYDSTNDVFIAPQPFSSWTLDSNYDWQPPVSYPTDNRTYTWNEDNQTWDVFTPIQPFSSWTWNATNWEWQPPTPMPTDGQTYEWNEDNQTWDIVCVDCE